MRSGIIILENKGISNGSSVRDDMRTKWPVKVPFRMICRSVRPPMMIPPHTIQPALLYCDLSRTNAGVAAVAEWYGYRTVAYLVTSSSPVPLKTRRVGQICTLNLSRAETSSRWCGVVVRRGGASSGVVHVP
ncbi:uncharacterized protein TNCV_735761 [Trichonephila clavipes]|uniref:Uncharacterized protein n=1 Tax=Trichonephila clavipes TaxID=2585209 RepID=A0A8X6VKS4_TRICX|nr:uncharacterized protein TNCV_735761 [Trichonephila clavipes]